MPGLIECPSCGEEFQPPRQLGAGKLRCPECGHAFKAVVESWECSPPPSRRPTPFKSRANAGANDVDDDESCERRAKRSVVYEAPRPASRVALGLGLASLLVGVMAVPLTWVPLVGKLSLVIGGGALLLGFFGLVLAALNRGEGLAFPVAGSAVSLVALGLATIQSLGLLGGRSGIGDVKNAESSLEAASTLLGSLTKDVPEPGPTLEKNTTPSQDAPWLDASKGMIQFGEVRIMVGHVLVAPVRQQGLLGTEESPDAYLGIQLFIENIGRNRKIDYTGWSRSSAAGLRLIDNFGNNYRRKEAELLAPVIGQVHETKPIHPGERLEDLLVFEKPLPNVQWLRLELPASALGRSGTFRLQLPKSMLQR